MAASGEARSASAIEGGDGASAAALRLLVESAVLAPSGDNLQPWRFVCDAARGEIRILLDEARDPSPMNSGQRMSRIAIGAALENMARTAGANGWEVQVQVPGRAAAAVIHLRKPISVAGGVEEALRSRVTNRRKYDGRPVSESMLAELRSSTPAGGGVRTVWLAERGQLERLAELIGEADAVMFGNPSMRLAFLGNVRFDLPPEAAAPEGLPLASLEVGKADRVALRLMRRIPNWLLKSTGGLRVFASTARGLVASASGLCVIAAESDDAPTDFIVGRSVQRAWLALTERGLAVQPMSSIPVLHNAIQHGGAALRAALGPEKVSRLVERCRELVPELGEARPAFLMRFGRAPAPTGRTGRLPLEAVTTSEGR
jgi:nitroreductase